MAKHAVMHFGNAQVSAWRLISSMVLPGGNRYAYGTRAACVAGNPEQHMGLVAEGAHITLYAETGRTGDRWPLVLPSHNGKLVAGCEAM